MSNFSVSASSSSLMLSPKKYDVFLSFRGEDTRDNITSHLYEALDQKKVETYIDYKLEKGEGIGPALITAIEESHVSVVIFSENYASSKWCLDEIVKIMECKKDRGQIVIPVFYKIDPSHVRNQRGTYEIWFKKHEIDLARNNSPRLFNWRSALTEAANLSGWDFHTYSSESQFIKDIVKDILQRLNLVHPIDPILKGVVGIEENYEGVKSLLEMDSKEVQVIGIWGMGGIGKTTLAIALHAKLSSQFEGHCFLANVREETEKNSINFMRNKLFSELLEEENLHVNVPKVEYRHVTNRLRRKKVLIVLDDVANSEQLDDLISDYDWLGLGSRVIVTTRDKHSISIVDKIYEMKELNKHNSLELFCLNAFKAKHPKSGYEELSKNVVANCKGNPLALKVLGARFRSRSKEVWESELEKLKKIPDMKIQNELKSSYDDLDDDQKNIFLDIACFVKEESKDRITNLFKAYNFFPDIGINDLVEKSLVTISNKGTIQMHDLIQEMGWNIVHQESPKDPGSRSRLWNPNEVYDVLKYNKGTKIVEGITLDVSKIEDLHLSSDSFTKMSEMRYLKFYYGKWNGTCNIYLPNGLDSLSDKLRYLEWHRYCLNSLPSKFRANLLVELCMPFSKLQKLWDGVQDLGNLKEIDLRFSKELVEVPDLSKARNLEWLSLSQCRNLREIHPSILSLDKLKDLELEGCTKIESLIQMDNNHLKSLQNIQLSNCSSLKEFSFTSNNLENLWLDGTSIRELSSSIWCCEKLKMIDLHNCDNLEGFGDDMQNYIGIGSLNTIDLSGCKGLNASNLGFHLKSWQATLRSLDLENCCNLETLPDSIGLLSSLQCLKLSGSNVESLSPNIKNLNNLKELRLDNCKKLVYVPELPSSLRLFSAINCISLITDLTTLDIAFEHRPKRQPYPQVK
ncbi:disease resistance protein RPV1-like isoform X2 [Vicia villosa]|uniref:disease resistance protein RPV1-like isoform X2 n=1 Tax=Vicia villosa TaxID=3911 RepID=UPI00273C662E|nr:disease resistance protein RPV1-like isoform X2 [Vicia villosa]